VHAEIKWQAHNGRGTAKKEKINHFNAADHEKHVDYLNLKLAVEFWAKQKNWKTKDKYIKRKL